MNRRDFIRITSLLPLLHSKSGISQIYHQPLLVNDADVMPVFFVGHQDFSKSPHLTPFTKSLREMGKNVKPTTILVLSAHWLSYDHTWVNLNTQYLTPEYPSIGNPEMANTIHDNLNNIQLESRELDHGAWSVLRHICPDRSIPVMEMSIDMTKPFDYHYQLARELSFLRRKGVLIIGSGNIVHNLELTALKFWTKKPFDWALEFDHWVHEQIMKRDLSSLFQYYKMGKTAAYAVPTVDHYLPMLYTMSLCETNDDIQCTYAETERGLSYRCYRIG